MLFTPDNHFNIAIIGGGKSCASFLELFQEKSVPEFHIRILAVCDKNPRAEGILLAKKIGIPTLNDFPDIFDLKDLNTIILFTNNKEILIELIKLRPAHVSLIERNMVQFFLNGLGLNKKLKSVEHQMNIQKMSEDFIIQNSDAAIALVDTNFIINEVNDAYLKIVNKEKKDVLGKYCYKIYYGLNRPCASSNASLNCPMLETLKTGKRAQVIHEYPKSKDLNSYCTIVTYPLKNQEGEIVEVIEIWKDITEELSNSWKKRTRELKADMNEMIQEDRMISLGKLVASCVHEINNPIQGLLTFSDLMIQTLDKGDLSPEENHNFRKYLSMMSTELERCGDIVSGLLSFSRETPREYRGIYFREILDSVLFLAKHKMELQNIQLKTDLTSEIIMIRGDTNQLQQVFLNLVFNAMEAMPKGGKLYIRTRLNKNTKNLEIELQDTGEGIPQKAFDHIFDPFFTTKKEGKGTGLGLSIVYGIVKNHGGDIHVKNQPGIGATFILHFPVLA